MNFIDVENGEFPENCNLFLGKFQKNDKIEYHVVKIVYDSQENPIKIIGHHFGFDMKHLTLLAYATILPEDDYCQKLNLVTDLVFQHEFWEGDSKEFVDDFKRVYKLQCNINENGHFVVYAQKHVCPPEMFDEIMSFFTDYYQGMLSMYCYAPGRYEVSKYPLLFTNTGLSDCP